MIDLIERAPSATIPLHRSDESLGMHWPVGSSGRSIDQFGSQRDPYDFDDPLFNFWKDKIRGEKGNNLPSHSLSEACCNILEDLVFSTFVT